MDSAVSSFGTYSHTNKRSHARMEVEDSSSPRWSPSASVPPSHTSNHVAFLNHNMPRRYIGDGMDFRRPVTSDVIDLTEDDTEPAQEPPQEARHRARRQPRFGRNIMDVIDLEAEETQAPPPPLSPEIQFVSSRPISPARRPNRPTYEIRDEDENEVEFVSENRRARPMMRTHDEIVRDLHRRDQRHRETEAMMNQFLQRALPPRAPPRARRGGVHTGFMPPHRMQYAMAAFDLGYLHDEEDILPPAPTYNAPAEAPEGFTRSPQEEGALICPNCEDELCVGESERKKQVWIVKSCGHVYCGDCTAHRHTSKSSAKGKEKQPTSKKFSKCVIEGCAKRVSGQKAMIQIFL